MGRKAVGWDREKEEQRKSVSGKISLFYTKVFHHFIIYNLFIHINKLYEKTKIDEENDKMGKTKLWKYRSCIVVGVALWVGGTLREREWSWGVALLENSKKSYK